MLLRRFNISLLVLFALLATIGCKDKRQSTLRTSFVAINTAREGFETWEDAKQDQIIAEAKTKEEGVKALEDFRAKRNRVYASLEIALISIALASMSTDEASFQAALRDIKDLFAKLKELKGEK